jgi:hypothetical protein
VTGGGGGEGEGERERGHKPVQRNVTLSNSWIKYFAKMLFTFAANTSIKLFSGH